MVSRIHSSCVISLSQALLRGSVKMQLPSCAGFPSRVRPQSCSVTGHPKWKSFFDCENKVFGEYKKFLGHENVISICNPADRDHACDTICPFQLSNAPLDMLRIIAPLHHIPDSFLCGIFGHTRGPPPPRLSYLRVNTIPFQSFMASGFAAGEQLSTPMDVENLPGFPGTVL